MYSLYLKCLALLLVIFGSLGGVGPYLISAPSDLAVILGLLYLTVVLPYLCYQIIKSIKKDLGK
jgi:hypothetical protein